MTSTLPALPPTLMAAVEKCARSVNTHFSWTPAFRSDISGKLISDLDDLIPKGLEYMEATRTYSFTIHLGNKFEAFTKDPNCSCPTHKVWVPEQAQHGVLFARAGLGTIIKTVRDRYKDMFVVDIDYKPASDATPEIQRKITKWIIHGKIDSIPVGCRCIGGAAFENSSLVFTIATKPFMNALRAAEILPVEPEPEDTVVVEDVP